MYATVDKCDHYLYLSTPETTPIQVEITLGNGQFAEDVYGNPLDAVTLSNSAPVRVDLGDADAGIDVPTLLRLDEVGSPGKEKGLILKSDRPFYCNLRVVSPIQGGSLTSKGEAALGQDFRLGHIMGVVMNTASIQRSNFFSVMATEDGTRIELKDFDPGIRIQTPFGPQTPPNPYIINLDRGESYVGSLFYNWNDTPANSNGIMGAQLISDHPVVVNCGSWLGAPLDYNNQDIGIDQIVPVDLTREEYILVRGDGPDVLETPIVIATEDNTDIFLNDDMTPFTTLDAGDWISIPSNRYINDNMYIRGTAPIYVYQNLAGANDTRTGGLNFIPSIGCSEEKSINNILDINLIGNQTFEGKLFIVAENGADVFINNNLIPTALFTPVTGHPDYMTYKAPNLTGNIDVRSNGAIQVGIFGRNNAIGWAGYFSGFKKAIKSELSISLSSECDGSIFIDKNIGLEDIEWFHNQKRIPFNSDTIYEAPPGTYYVVGKRFFCNEEITDTSRILVLAEPLEWNLTSTSVPCANSRIGKISVTKLKGGFRPLTITANGVKLDQNRQLDSLNAGTYFIEIIDSLGCVFYDSIEIRAEKNSPQIALFPDDTINCFDPKIELNCTLSNLIGKPEFNWSTSSGNIIGSLMDSSIQINEAGWYQLLVTDDISKCSTKDSIYIHKDVRSPILNLNGPSELNCNFPELTLSANYSSAHDQLDFNWSTVQGRFLSKEKNTAKVDSTGQYILIIQDLINGCQDTASIIVTENKTSPILQATDDTLNCIETIITIAGVTNHSGPLVHEWKHVGDGILEGTNTIEPKVNLPGTYIWIALDTSNGCSDTISVNISQDTTAPIIELTDKGTLTCTDSIFIAEAIVSNQERTTLEWSSIQPMINDPKENILITQTSGSYYLLATDPQNGCTAIDSIKVNRILPPEAFEFNFFPPDCEERTGAVYLEKVIGGTPPYDFWAPEISSPPIRNSYQNLSGGLYHLYVKDAHDCVLVDSIEVLTFTPIELDILKEDICVTLGDQTEIRSQINLPLNELDSLSWSDTIYLDCDQCLSPGVFPLKSQFYRLQVWDKYGCSDADGISIRLKSPKVFIPNVFTPDGNQINDGFTAFTRDQSVKGIKSMTIYDRWGEMLFKTADIPVNQPQYGWKGDFHGEVMQPGVFAYLIDIEFIDGTIQQFAGDVTLVR